MNHAPQRSTPQERARERLIVALDFSTGLEAHKVVALLGGKVGMFKIGSQLFCSEGPVLVRDIVGRGEKIFLDLKFHDIPNTVAAAAVAATRLRVRMFNLHAAAGRETMLRTRDAVAETATKEGLVKPHVLAVTVLTSSTESTLKETGVSSTAQEQVKRLALLAESAGMDGVVASPREVSLIRSVISREFLIVTPGVRPESAELNDQKRVATPREAMLAGSDYLVVGRPITAAADPALAAEEIIGEMALAFK